MCVKVRCTQLLVLCVVDIPPNPQPYFQEIVDHICGTVESCRVILLGDFNLPDINLQILLARNSLSQSFCEFVCDHGLVQIYQ